MKGVNLRRFGLLIPLGMLTFVAPALYACSVPVFRYALERWQADQYEIEIIHHGPLEGEAKAAVDFLASYADGREVSANLWMRLKDTRDDIKTPALINIYLPGGTLIRTSKPIWSSPLTKETVKKVVDSPLRKEIVHRLLDGDSAVWILLESGDREKDNTAAALLKEQLKMLEDSLEMSEPPTMEVDSENGLALRPSFSLVHLGRDDSEEAFLVASLLRTEPDLLDYNEPMAFPIFGRGHILYALVGEGINPDNIRQACEFIIGPCSCIVKAQNPGVDLLLAANWDEQIEPLLVVEEPLPPLAGVFSTSTEANEAPANEPPATSLLRSKTAGVEIDSDGSEGGTKLLGIVVLTLLAIVVLAILGSVMVVRREKSHGE